jgi:hypothetical protein
MKPRHAIIIASPLIAALALPGCAGWPGSAGWKTRFSGKYDQSNEIDIHLHNDGNLMLGHGGISRVSMESYGFYLKPIRSTYIDDEIELSRHGEHPKSIRPVKGSVSFDRDYSHVTINIQVFRDGHLVTFPGNGTYRINPDL